MILPRQTNLVTFNARNQTSINVVALASTLTAVRLGQLDTTAFDLIDRADVDAIGADYFHVFCNFGITRQRELGSVACLPIPGKSR
jgi:hypothetical protein